MGSRENENGNNMDDNVSNNSSTDENSVNTSQSGMLGTVPGQTGNGPITRSRLRQQSQAGNANANVPDFTHSRRHVSKRPVTGGGDASQPKILRQDNNHNSQPRSLNEPLDERRSLVKQQNEALEKSLKADREKERIKQENAKILEKLRERKLEAEKNLPKPPDDKEEGIITIVIRLPSGKTSKRNFRPTDSLYCLRNFVLGHDETPLLFEIIRYPNEIVPAPDPTDDDTGTGLRTLQEHGFTKKEVLHIREQPEKKCIPNLFGNQQDNK